MTFTNENDEAYANAVFIDNSEEIVADWIKKAERFRAKKLKSGTAKIDIAYGASNRQKFDIFLPVIDETFSLEKTIDIIEKKNSKLIYNYLIILSKIKSP